MAAALALLSSLLWGTGDFLGGTLSRRLPALAVYGGSQVSGLLIILAAAFATNAWSADLAYLPWGVLTGVIGMAGLVAFYAALGSGRMGIVAPVASLSVIVPLAAGLLRGDAPTSVQILGIVLAIGGIVLASGPELSDEASTRPVLLALLSALLIGILYITLAEGSRSSPIMTTVAMRVTTLSIAAGIALATRSLGGLRRRDAPQLAAVGLFDSSANVVWGVSTGMGMLSITSVLGALFPVVTVVLAAVVHHERLRPVQYAGIAAAILGTILISAGG